MSENQASAQHRSDFRRCLIDGDAAGLMVLWNYISPHLPQPKSIGEATVTLHRARTEAQSVPLALRVYSHSWLTERGYPSGLSDELRPKVERVHPVIVSAVGIAVKASSPERNALAAEIQKAMSDAVLEMYAEGVTDPVRIRAHMQAARERVKRAG